MVFLLIIQTDGVVDVVDHCDKYEDIEAMALKYIGSATLIKEDHEAQNDEVFYKKISDQCYALYEATDRGYIFENWTLKETCKVNVVHYMSGEEEMTYAKIVKKSK